MKYTERPYVERTEQGTGVFTVDLELIHLASNDVEKDVHCHAIDVRDLSFRRHASRDISSWDVGRHPQREAPVVIDRSNKQPISLVNQRFAPRKITAQ